MIVPFLFTLDEYSKEYPTYQWVFYKFMDFCLKNKTNIIAQSKFFLDVDPNHSAKSDQRQKVFDYSLPTKNDLEKNEKYSITTKEEEQIISDYDSVGDAWVDLLVKSNEKIECIIEEKINAIEKDNNKKVEAILTWVWLPTLEKIASKRNIKIIQLELSTIRRTNYNTTLGYFQFFNKYDSAKYTEKYYNEFKKQEKLLFNRKELLSLFLNKEALSMIKFLYSIPKYKIGYALGIKNDFFEQAYSKMTSDEVLKRLSNEFDRDDVLVREHPASKDKNISTKFTLDKSIYTPEWISKCETIICDISNVGYETILYGKNIISINDSLPTAFSKFSNLKYFEEEKIGIEKLNFLTFYWYTPYELMFDKKYIQFRMKNPSIIDIYNYNLDYILKQKNINKDKLKELSLKDREDYILKCVHNLSKEERNKIIEFSYRSVALDISEKERKIANLEEKINNLNESYSKLEQNFDSVSKKFNSVLNSKSWKITKPLRRLTSLKKGNHN